MLYEFIVYCVDAECDRYKDALVSLTTDLLQKLQFRYNQSQLEELDDDVLDDDVRSLLCPISALICVLSQYRNFIVCCRCNR